TIRLGRGGEAADRSLLSRDRELQPRVAAQQRRGEDVEPHRAPVDDLATAAAEQPLHLVPCLGATVRVEGVGQDLLGLEERSGAAEALARLDLAELLDQHRLEVRTQRLVIAVRAVVELVREELPGLELAEHAPRGVAPKQLVAETA